MIGKFALRATGWTIALATGHSALRALTGVIDPGLFVPDLLRFFAALLALGAMVGGVAVTQHSENAKLPKPRRILLFSLVAAGLGLGAYVVVDQIAPTVSASALSSGGATVTPLSEPSAFTSAEIRREARDLAPRAVALDAAGGRSADIWRDVNRLAFEHERRIVQSLLVPVLALVGLFAGFRARALGTPWRSPALWGLGLFLVFSMFMAGENGYELIVLRSAGPMAFVPWLQAVVPGSVLVGLVFSALPELFARWNNEPRSA